MNIFEKASKIKLRFTEQGGSVQVEDLWDLPLTGNRQSLDTLYKIVNKALKDTEEESIIVKSRKSNTTQQLKFDVVKYVIEVRLADNEKREHAATNKLKKDRLLNILADKEDEKERDMSPEDIRKLIESLG